MNNKLHVGQLPYSVDSDTLAQFFSAAGNVTSAKVITDRETGRSKGFGFVEMSNDNEAQSAISQFDGKDFNGRNITVSIAKPQEPRTGGGGRGGFGGGRGGGRGGFGGGRNNY